MTDTQRRDGNIVAEQNREAVLHWLHRFGGLTTRQLGRLVWPGGDAGMRMAQITTRGLIDDKLILRRPLRTGGAVYVISEAGARYLRALGLRDISSRGHRDLGFDKPLHRFLANEHTIDQHLAGRKVWTEFEVQRRRAPVPKIIVNRSSKIPDGVFESPGGLIWLEVENAFKSQARIQELVTVARELFSGTGPCQGSTDSDTGRGYSGMLFLSSDTLRLTAILRCINQAWDNEKIDQDIALKITLAEASMSSGYVWNGIIRSISAYTFLIDLERIKNRQAAIRKLLGKYESDFVYVDNQGLWTLFIQVLGCLDVDIENISSTIRSGAADYDELLEARVIIDPPHFEQIRAYLTTLDRAIRTTDIDINRECFEALCDGVPLLPKPPFVTLD